MPPKLTHEIITAAIDGFESQKTRIDAQIQNLRAMLSGSPAESAATPEPAKSKRRKMSAAGRRAIAEAQRKRWAALKKAAEPLPATPEAPQRKRRLSRAGRAAIIAATKKRWALKRAEAAKIAPKKATKKAAGKKPPARVAAKKTAPASETATQLPL